MKKILSAGLLVLLCGCVSFAEEAAMNAIEGTVKKVDAAAKTIVVRTASGAEHTLHFVGRTTVHGAEATETGMKDTFHGLKEGTEVVAHYTAKGGEETAEEVDRVGSGGLKTAEGTVSHIDRAGKTIVVKAADGTEETYRLTDHAAKDAGKGIAQGTEKSAKVTVYYTEEAGKKVAHFFKAL